ncbi:hypothetical protein [Paenibacillus lautus]|uniref:hypothetical protein n=1 Tax=Paenibacillus lautus TaxID=1401 RepID=UPI003D9A69AB
MYLENKSLEQVKEILSYMGINKALIIDDKVFDNIDVIQDIVQGEYDNDDFKIKEVVKRLGIDKKQLSNIERLPKKLVEEIKYEFSSLVCSEIEPLKKVVAKIFGNKNVKLLRGANSKITFNNDTVLFLDYKLEESEVTSELLTKILAQKATNSYLPRCIIFISKDQIFTIDTNSYEYDMKNPREKSKYFRDLRQSQDWKEYKNSLYDYINKTTINDEQSVLNQLYGILHNLYGGQQFFKLLNQIENVLSESSDKVLGKFHLLNARSIQEMIREKVIEEGESESTFIMNWISRHIAKTVIQDDTFSADIHYTLKEINAWTDSFYEVHEDVALKDILISEMWDKGINKRYSPVDFGDVFQIIYNNKPKRAILLTQTCTVAVRRDGERSGKVALLAIENPLKKGSKSGVTIDDINGDPLTFDLDDTISYPLSLLDITTLNDQGSALLQGTTSNSASFLPQSALWSEGYQTMMTSVVESLLNEIIQSQNKVIQIDQTWIPYETEGSTHKHLKYKFPIDRLYRLDSQYASYIFQSAQAWWGRVGLPVDVNFMNDYEEKEGRIRLHGSEFSAKFYLKKRLNEITDIGVSLEDLENSLKTVYKNDIDAIAQIELAFSNPQLARLYCSSGKKMMSLKQQKLALQILSTHEIYIKYEIKEVLTAEMIFGKFSKCYLENKDISEYVTNFSGDLSGRYKFLMSLSFLESLQLTDKIPSIDKRKIIDEKLGEAINMNTSDKSIFNYQIKGEQFRIIINKDKVTAEQLATTLSFL